MSPLTTLAAYAAALALVFVAALGVGRLVGPVGTVSPHDGGHSTDSSRHGG